MVCGDNDPARTGGFGAGSAIYFGSPVILGPISRARFEAVIHSHAPRFLECAPAEIRPLDITMRLVAGADGGVTSVVVKKANTTDPEVRGCFANVLEMIALPPADSAVIASVPVHVRADN